MVSITDGNGNPVCLPIQLSEFEKRSKSYVSAKAEKELQIQKPVIDKFQLAQWAKNVNRLVARNYCTHNKTRFTVKLRSRRKKKGL